MSSFLFLSFFFFLRSFSLDGQTTKPAPQQTVPTSRQSPNRLKSHSISDLRPPDPGGPYQQHVSYNQPQPENEDNMPPKMRKRWMHRELESLRGLNGNTTPSSSSSRDHLLVGFSESPDGSSTSGVSLGSPIIPSSKLMKGSGLGNNGHERGAFFFFHFPDFFVDVCFRSPEF